MQLQGIKNLLNLPGYKVICMSRITDYEIHFDIEPYERKKPVCSHCKEMGHHYHSQQVVVVEDLRFGERRVFLHVTKRYYYCSQDNRIHVEQIDWLGRRSRVTKRFASNVS